jgi:hypothetical protein
MSVLSSGTELERQNYGMHQSRRGCFNSMTASLGDMVIPSVMVGSPISQNSKRIKGDIDTATSVHRLTPPFSLNAPVIC